MQSGTAYRIAALVAAVGVGLGAFGAHGLKEVLVRHDTVAIWHTAVLYHLVHAVVLFAMAQVAPSQFRRGPWLALLVGILVFSGSLYVLAVTGIRWLGAITPLGGLAFLVGWCWLAICRGADRDIPRG